jgi:hypothetical protein
MDFRRPEQLAFPRIYDDVETTPHLDPHQVAREAALRWSARGLEVVRDRYGRL